MNFPSIRRSKRPLILGAALFIGLAISTAVIAAEPTNVEVLESDALHLGIDPDRFSLVSLKDRKAGHEFLESLPDSPFIWALNMQKPDGTDFILFANGEARRSIERSADGQTLTLVWSGLEVAGEADAMDVRVTITLPKGADRSHWTIKVDNRSKSSLMNVVFPHLSGISKAAQPTAAVPRNNWGGLEKNVTFTGGSYPCSYWPSQFLALLERDSGLYLAFEDPRATPKHFELKPGEFFTFRSFAENASLPGNDYETPGSVAIGVCGNDWWVAAKMFRRWALHQPWTKRGPLNKASSLPELAKTTGVWFNEILADEDPQNVISKFKAAQDYFKLPIALQIYTWHRPKFDTLYPEYFPARPNFQPVVDAVRASDTAFVVPYINGRLQDIAAPSGKEAKAWMARKRDGTHYNEEYGTGANFAVMCPATAYWQKTILDVATKLAGEYNVNGIYIDQIAAAEYAACFDASHGHPLGGGSYWVDGYRKMLEGVKQLRTREGNPLLITSENNTDCYMDVVDGFLIWTPRYAEEIPIMQAVYSGYTIYFASNAQVKPDTELLPYAMVVGRDVIWGVQPGWMPLEVETERSAYLRDASRLRHAGLKFFQFGELVGELKPLSDPGQVKGIWRNVLGTAHEETALPAVMSTVWKSPEGSLGVAIANLSGEKKTFAYNLDPTVHGVSLAEGEQWRITKITSDSTTPLESAPGRSLSREEKLEPWEIRLIEIAPPGQGRE